MRDDGNGPADHQWGRFGFLIADFFTLLAMLFLVANTVGYTPRPTPTPTPPSTTGVVGTSTGPTPTPVICGLSPQPLHDITITLANDGLLRQDDRTTEQQVAQQIKTAIKTKYPTYASKSIGLAEVWGGSFQGGVDSGNGVLLAKGAIGSLKLLANEGFMFTPNNTIYQSLWLGTIQSNQITLTLFPYNVTLTNSCSHT